MRNTNNADADFIRFISAEEIIALGKEVEKRGGCKKPEKDYENMSEAEFQEELRKTAEAHGVKFIAM